MAVTPSTNLRLLKLPLEIDNKNQLTFQNRQAQLNYFNSLEALEIEDISYQRKDNMIRFPGHIDTILEYNYCMYQNENYSDKWFYAFIVNMSYENDGLTNIYITTDVFQTWQFDFSFKQSFIEREMINVNNDIPGVNLLAEGLETGEFKVNNTYEFNELKPIAVIAYTRNPNTDGLTTQTITDTQGINVNGIPNGMFFWITSFDYLHGALHTINSKGHGDAILTIFTIPAFSLVGFKGWTLQDILSGVSEWIVRDFKSNPFTKGLTSTPDTLDGYSPRNQKLKTYPYCYLGFNPPNGSSKIYRYENFPYGTPIFNMVSEVSPNPSVCFIPQNYRGNTGNSLEDLATLEGYPTIGWITDYFNTWLAQNSEIIKLQMDQEKFNYDISAVRESIGLASNIASAGIAGYNIAGYNRESSKAGGALVGPANSALVGTANSALDIVSLEKNHEYYIKNQMAQIEKQAMLPNSGQLSGSNSTLLGYDLLKKIMFTSYSIKYEFAERIDKFFDMYGYLTNNVKLPNLSNRPNWNYVKTIGANIIGNIPQLDLEAIKNIFNNGVTLWHNPSTFLDYSQNNR